MIGIEEFVLGYLVNSLWQVPVVGVAGCVCARLMRRMGPQAEQWVWVTALAMAAILPACGRRVWMPHGFGAGGAANGMTAVQVEIGRFTQSAGAVLRLPLGLRHGAVAVYLGFVLFVCVRLGWGLIQSERLRRSARRVVLAEEWADVWERHCRLFDVRDAEIASTPMIAGPLTLGFRRRMLLLPPDFMETAEASDVEAALGHEFAHMRRRDFAKNVLYELISLPVSYHPMTRWMKAQIRQSRELVCDAMAAEFVTTREHYARSLLRLASMISDRTQTKNIHAIGIFDANILERRVMNLMMKRRETRGVLRVGFAAACVVVGLATCGSALALRLEVKEAVKSPADHGGTSESKDFVAPILIYKKQPVYPVQARAEKNTLDGACVVGMTVGKDGVPSELHIVKSLRDDYDSSALEAVREWRFSPALRAGAPVVVETKIEIRFQII